MCAHKVFVTETEMNVYFCDPSSPWQRGTNVNTNGLVRQYFPKQTSLASNGQTMLGRVAAKLNSRPRKTLDYKTPAQVFNEVYADRLNPSHPGLERFVQNLPRASGRV